MENFIDKEHALLFKDDKGPSTTTFKISDAFPSQRVCQASQRSAKILWTQFSARVWQTFTEQGARVISKQKSNEQCFILKQWIETIVFKPFLACPPCRSPKKSTRLHYPTIFSKCSSRSASANLCLFTLIIHLFHSIFFPLSSTHTTTILQSPTVWEPQRCDCTYIASTSTPLVNIKVLHFVGLRCYSTRV